MPGAWVTGIGCVTPVGTGVEAFADALRQGRSGTGPLSLLDPRPYSCRVAAEVEGFRPSDFLGVRESRTSPRVVQLAVAAARLACEHADLRGWRDPTRVAILLGTSVGCSSYVIEQAGIFLERGIRRVHPSAPAQAQAGVLASECAIQLGVHGPALTLSSACTSSADAIGWGCDLIAAGSVDVVLAGGSEAPFAPLTFAAFDRLGMMPTSFNEEPERACRPFSADREGMVMAEGSAVLVLESAAHARARGQRALAEVAGYGATCDAASHFFQDESGVDAGRALEIALERAGLGPADVDYVNAHGTATRQNDPFETRVLRRVLGAEAERIPVSSSKSMLGHLLGASAAIEAAATALALDGGFVPPTINLEEPDPECDLDYVPNRAREAPLRAALSTSFGFGSRNAALVLRRCEDGGG